MAKQKNKLFKLDMLILAVLYHSDHYGYEISKNIRELTNHSFDLKDGVLYPILYKLSQESFITSYEKQVGRKIRVYYHIEKKGKEALLEMIKEYREMLENIDQLLGEINHEK